MSVLPLNRALLIEAHGSITNIGEDDALDENLHRNPS